MARAIQAFCKKDKIYDGEIPNCVWKAPNGKIIGIFYNEQYYSCPSDMVSAGVEALDRSSVEQLAKVSSVFDVQKYMEKINNEKVYPAELGRMVNMACDWL